MVRNGVLVGLSSVFRLLVAAGLLATPRNASAQAEVPPPGGEAVPAEPAPDRPRTDAYIDDSFEANEAFEDARRAADEHRWEDAARIADRLLSRHGDKLVRKSSHSYRPMGSEVLAWMRAWPPEALAAYRRLFDAPAQEALAASLRARDSGELYLLLDRYFCARAAIDMVEALGQSAIEEGDFEEAIRLYRQFWDESPDAAAQGGRVASRLALVHALAGSVEPAKEWTAKAVEAGVESVRWLGLDRPIAALVESVLAKGPQPVAAESAFEWPLFGGDTSRTRVVDFKVREAASLWRYEDPAGSGSAPPGEVAPGRQDGGEEGGRRLGIHAIIARDLVIVHDALRAWAIRVESGKPAWTYSAFDSETVRRSGRDGLAPRWHAPTYHDGRLYLCLGSESVPYYGSDGDDLASTLVCLDAATGRELWRADQTGLEAAFSRCDFDSAPLVLHDKVFLIVRRRRSFGFEDCYLCRFDAHTGQVETRTHLGSASTGGFGFRRPTLSVPAVADGEIVVLSNLGTVARVSPRSGRVSWMTLYDRRSDAQAGGGPHESAPWQYNPVLYDGRHLVGLPLDSGELLVLGPTDGEVQRTIPTSSLADAVSLLGLRDGVLYGLGEKAFAYDLNEGRMRWLGDLPADEEPYGRGCLTATQLLAPTRSGFRVFALDGALESSVKWETPEDAGNLLATPNQILVVAHERVSAYARKQDVWERLHARMAAAPHDPAPVLDFAEVALRGSDSTESLSALEEAVRRAGGFATLVDPELRKRVFEDCLALADKLAPPGAGNTALAIKLLGYAAQCTPDLEADVVYRVKLAELHLRTEKPESAVELFQQLISDRSLRSVPLPLGLTAAAGRERPTAGAMSRDQIDRLIEAHGEDVYRRFETQASEALAAGVQASDLTLLDRVVESYPNSTAAARALVEGGRILRRDQRPDEAVRRLTSAHTHYAARLDSVEVLRLIADCHADAGRRDAAWRWLTRAAREHPAARIDVDGSRVSFEQYRDRLGDIRAEVEPARPAMTLPLDSTFVKEFDEQFELLEPIYPERPGAAWDGFVVYQDAKLQLYNAAGGQPRWAEPAPCRMKPDLLAITAQWALFSTRHQITALDPRDGRELWHFGKYPADVDDALADHERFDFFKAVAIGQDKLVAIQDDGRMVCIQLADGRVLWRQSAELRPSGPVVIADSWVAYAAGQAGSQLCRIVDLESGEPLNTIEFPGNRRAERLVVSLEDHLYVLFSQAFGAFDPRSGETVWFAERERNILTESVQVDLDGVYFSDDGRHVTKLGQGGRVLWQSDPIAPRPSEALSACLVGASLVVSSERRMDALDGFDGRRAWEGTLPNDVVLGKRALTRSYAIAIESLPANPPSPIKAYFFDHRGRSGRLAEEGGVLELGAFPDFKAASVRDDAILLVTDKAIRGWHRGQ